MEAIPSESQLGVKLKLLEEAGAEAKQFSESVLISLLIDEKDNPGMYEEEIHQRRLAQNETYQYVVNIFGQQLESKISVRHRINQFGGYRTTSNPMATIITIS